MSAETKATLDAAIQAHVRDENKGPGEAWVTGYTMFASYSSMEDTDQAITRHFQEYADFQPFHVALGLVSTHKLILEDQFRSGV